MPFLPPNQQCQSTEGKTSSNAIQSKLQGHELSTTLLLIMAFNLTARQWSPLIMRYRDSHISMSVSCKSTRLNKSSGDRLKSCEVRYNIGVRRCNFCVSVHKVVLNQWACCVTGSVQLTCCEYEWMCVCDAGSRWKACCTSTPTWWKAGSTAGLCSTRT